MHSLHNHSDYSSASRSFADSSMKIKDMVLRAKELGLKSICLSDHEILAGHIKAKQLEKELDFPVLLGNEIYLVSDKQDEALRENYDKETMFFPHFLLVSLNEEGHKQLRELSTYAWEKSYSMKGLQRTTTLMSEVKKVIGRNQGNVVGLTACLGGFIPQMILKWKRDGEEDKRKHIEYFFKWGIKTFGEGNFFLECQPAREDNEDQWIVNNTILELSEEYDIPYVITTDSHYLKKENLNIHKAFLNSDDDGGDREVEEFYATAYIMSEDEVVEYFKPHWSMSDIKKGIENTSLIGDRAERFIFDKKPSIPRVKFDDSWEKHLKKDFFPNTEYIQMTLNSTYEDDRYLMYLLQKGMKKLISPLEYKIHFDKLEEELAEVWHVSEILEDRMHSYFISVSKIIDIMWNEGDSLVGTGRGSVGVCLIAYLLEIIQTNPIKAPIKLPFYRFMTRERVDFLDIDIDSQHDRREHILQALKDYFKTIDGSVVSCSTYSTLTSKSAVLTACRAINIDTDEAQAISSLIPVERGNVWSIHETYYGDKKTGKPRITEFKNLIDSYSDQNLLDIILLIEGLIINRGIHAGGVFFLNDDIYEHNALMKSPSGVECTQWDLHDSEKYGLIKYDLLTTKGMSKIRKTLDLLIEDNYIEKKKTLKETYMSILDPMTLEYDTPETWHLLETNEVPDLFQFSTEVAYNTLEAIKPKNIIQLFQTNSLMRLLQQEGAEESPVERYVKYKNDISLAYKVIDKYEIPENERKIVVEYLKDYYFVADTQEIIMEIVQSSLIGFDVAGAHRIRKSIAKKDKEAQAKIKHEFYQSGLAQGTSQNTLDYIWKEQISLQLSYSFSLPHVYSYTTIALQELYLYQTFPHVYWNAACLTVNAGADDTISDKKNKTTNYGKIAKAISQFQGRGQHLELPNINTAKFGFTPDPEHNSIIFGIKGICGVGDESALAVINNRPYNSLDDFVEKMDVYKNSHEDHKFGNSTIASLIKAGSFDKLEDIDRRDIMYSFCERVADKTNKLTTTHIPLIMKLGVLTKEQKEYEYRLFRFRKYLYQRKFFYKKVGKSNSTEYYFLDEELALPFFYQYFETHMTEGKDYEYAQNSDGIMQIAVKRGSLDRVYKSLTKDFTEQVINNKEVLDLVNKSKVDELFNKYGSGTLPKWEMDSLSFYYTEHELAHIDTDEYIITNFFELPKSPVIAETYFYRGRDRKRYALYRIAGTVLDADRLKHYITLLTVDGVVTVKYQKGQFGFYNRQISHTFEGDDKKTVLEKSWFKRGNKLLITGHRIGDRFYPKKYSNSAFRHTTQLITEVREDGTLKLQSERINVDEL